MHPEDTVRLERSSLNPLLGLEELLEDLDGGENGFGGTPIYRGEMTLTEYLQHCCAMCNPEKVQPGRVPQTVFWVIDRENRVVGMVKMRHYLNDRLRDRGGHIGYFIKREKRGKGYGKESLRQALVELRKLGEERSLLTVDLDNQALISVIKANGAV